MVAWKGTVVIGAVLLLISNVVRLDTDIRPQRLRTPGYRNPLVTQSTLSTTVCHNGYSRSIRPPSSYTGFVKREEIRFWKLPQRRYEEDHFIPLSLGGSPYDTRNLWPEAYPQASNSDKLELRLWKNLCKGKLTLKEAQMQIIKYKRANG